MKLKSYCGAGPLACLLLSLIPLHAETGRDAWLRYAPVSGPALARYREAIPAVVTAIGDAAPVESARQEILRGVHGMLGRTLRLESGRPTEDAIVIGTLDDVWQTLGLASFGERLAPDAYLLRTTQVQVVGQAAGPRFIIVAGGSPAGALYGAFALLRKISLGESLANLNEQQTPYASVRWVNQWDNLDGSIERGYGGRSIFWDANHARADLSRVSEYGRLLASLGINAVDLSNVNANPRLLAPDFFPEIARIADAFRPWGVRVAISVDLGAPKTIGGLDTFDPLDQKVIDWWASKANALYAAIPDLAGFVLKADSEGRVGPSVYKRTHADAANVVARALKPHGGLFFYRGFVYDNHMDWNNLKNDRGRAAWDNFHDLDGKFDDNVLIQIKNGPIDFQVREPASPLFGALEKTNQAIELQVTQEYNGQGRHEVFLAPMWKETLDFDMHAAAGPTPVKALVAGKTFHRPAGGFVGVVNVGLDDNWFGNQLSQSNLYAFGRLAWNPDLSARQIEEEWARQTFGDDDEVLRTVNSIQLSSWRTYENYTGPLGLQTLTDITGNHFGVNVEASERNGWGQWHRADDKGVGMDRTVATGTGFIGQYRAAVAAEFETLAACPDDILLFMHHVPYTYALHNGKTVIQYIYDSHYEGAAAVADYVRQWKPLAGSVDEQRYREILAQLEYQAGQAVVWRDAVTNWFFKASGIADARGRVGHYPGRYEAEAMNLDGYTVRAITPAEDASGGKAVACPTGTAKCAATLAFTGAAGWYTLRVQYFDQNNGVAHFAVRVGSQSIDEWAASDRVPSARLDSTTSARRVITGVALRPGDQIRIEGVPDAGEAAALDYVEIEAELN